MLMTSCFWGAKPILGRKRITLPEPMIMNLHTLAAHESRMRPIDFGAKGQRSKSWGINGGIGD